jgi:uncharacterized membrane protein
MVLAHRHGFGHHLFVGPIILVLVVGALTYFVIARTRQHGHGVQQVGSTHDVAKHDVVSNSSAERILSERFAKGEIGLDDYRARLVALRETGVDPGDGASQAPTA